MATDCLPGPVQARFGISRGEKEIWVTLSNSVHEAYLRFQQSSSVPRSDHFGLRLMCIMPGFRVGEHQPNSGKTHWDSWRSNRSTYATPDSRHNDKPRSAGLMYRSCLMRTMTYSNVVFGLRCPFSRLHIKLLHVSARVYDYTAMQNPAFDNVASDSVAGREGISAALQISRT